MTISERLRAPAAPVATALLEIQAPVREQLDSVPAEMWRIVKADAPIITAANAHLMGMKGKMLRPTLLLLASALEDRSHERATAMAAVAELVHLASVVHDDSVDSLERPPRTAHDQRALFCTRSRSSWVTISTRAHSPNSCASRISIRSGRSRPRPTR